MRGRGGRRVEGTRFLEGHLVITPLGFVPIRLPSSCASLIGFSPSFPVTVTLLLSRAALSVFAFAEALAIFHTHLRSARPPFLPPFFSHANSNFEGNACIFPNSALSPGLPPLRRPLLVYPKLLSLHHSLSLFLPGPTHPYITSHLLSLSPSFVIHTPPLPSPVPQCSAPDYSRPLPHAYMCSDAQRRRRVADSSLHGAVGVYSQFLPNSNYAGGCPLRRIRRPRWLTINWTFLLPLWHACWHRK